MGALDHLNAEELYEGGIADGYGKTYERGCEANTDAWFREHLKRFSGLVVDAGCGSGKHFDVLEGAGQLVAVDVSPEMIANIKSVEGELRFDLDRDSLGSVVEAVDSGHPRIIVRGDMIALLEALEGRANHVACSFAIPYFDDPEKPVAAMHRALIPGGSMLSLSNVFVPRDLMARVGDFDVLDVSELTWADQQVPNADVFWQVLQLGTPQEPVDVPIMNTIHHGGHVERTFRDSQRWADRKLQLMNPMGCHLADPRAESGWRALFDEPRFQSGGEVFSTTEEPDHRYVKLCAAMVKA